MTLTVSTMAEKKSAHQSGHISLKHPRLHLAPKRSKIRCKPALKIGLPVLILGRPSISRPPINYANPAAVIPKMRPT